MQYALLSFPLFMVILYIGTEVQKHPARQAADTLYLYNTTAVCGATIVHVPVKMIPPPL